MRKILSILITLAALLSAPATATTDFYHHKDGRVTASYSMEDPAGCIQTDIWIYAYESLTKVGPGPLESSPSLGVGIEQVDWCGLGYLISASGTSTDVEIHASNSTTTASVVGRVELYNSVQGTTAVADIDLRWTGSGPLSVSTDNNFWFTGPSARTLARGSSRHRGAEVTGSIRYGGVDLTAGATGKGDIYYEQGSLVTINPDATAATAPPPAAPPAAPPVPPEGDLFSYRGGAATAWFVAIDPTGCVTTEVGILVSESRERYTTGGFKPSSQVGVSISRIDWCNSVELMRANGQDLTGSLQISSSLQEARVRGTAGLYDSIQGIDLTVDLDLTWTGEGPVSGRRDRLFSDLPNYRSMTKESGRSRAAEASGAVLYQGTNLLTGPSQSGNLFYGDGMTLRWR